MSDGATCGAVCDDNKPPHQTPWNDYAYEHAGSRLLERYRLFITRDVWDDWHAAIKSGDGALYIDEANEGAVWRVKMEGVAVFVIFRDGVIRTVLPNTGKYMSSARIAASSIGETSLGLKLPSTKKVPNPKKLLAKMNLLDQQRAHEHAVAAKLERIKLAEERTNAQARLFVRAIRAEIGHEAFKRMWDIAKAMFPDDPAWTLGDGEPQ